VAADAELAWLARGSAAGAGGTATLGGASLASYSADDVRTVISGCAQDPAPVRHHDPREHPAGQGGRERVAQRGTHRDLLLEGGLYGRMWAAEQGVQGIRPGCG
jgi:hypothetical protein